MPKVALIVCASPSALLEQAAEGFLIQRPGTPEAPFPTVPYWLALRQGGVRDDLIAMAAERGIPGWFDPPLCTFRELRDLLGSTDRQPLNDLERALILQELMRRAPDKLFGRPEAFTPAVDQLVADLSAEGVDSKAFAAALDARTDRDEFELRRDGGLGSLYGQYLEVLRTSGRRDGRDDAFDSASAVVADPAGLAARLRGRRELRIFGLQDLRRGWRALLQALAQSPALDQLRIYSAERLDLQLGEEVIQLEAPDTPATRLFTGNASRGPGLPALSFVAAPDAEREVEAVASRVRELADTGVPFNRIAIVSRRARPSVDLALAALDRFGVPAVARRRVRLGDIPVIRALRAMLDAAAEGWSRHGLAELAEQPFFGNDLDARVINLAGFRTRVVGLAEWSGAFETLIEEAEAREQPMEGGDDVHRSGFPSAATIRRATAGFARFEVHARTLSEARAATGWLTWLERFLAEDPWGILARIYAVPDGRYDLARTDLAGLRTLTLLLAEWRSALQQWGGADQILTITEFAAQLQSQLELDVPLWTTVQRGVQVLEGFAAAYRSFDHLFIIGLEAGNFPIRAPTSPLLDEVDRLSLFGQGLPFEPRETWDTHERELFRILLAGALQSITVSWSRLDPDGKEVLRSGFVEALAEAAGLDPDSVGEPIPASRVITPGARLTRGPGAVNQAVHAVTIERLRESGVLSPWNGQVTDSALLAWLAEEFGDNRLWSPSQLESYAKCPWAYFSGRLLGVDKREEPDEEIDPAMRGTVLHQALKIFFDGACQRIGGPVLLRQADLAWAQPALANALDQALGFQGSTWLGHPALQGVRRAELARLLARYLNSEVESNEKLFNNRTKLANTLRTAVESSEVGFKDMVLERGGVRIRYRGTIDRVEVGVDERAGAGVSKYLAAVDYKTTKYSAPGGAGKTAEAYADGVVIQIPLYAYALSQLRPGGTLSRLEYRALKQGDTIHSLDLVQVDTKSGTVSDNDEARAQYESALDAAADHVLAARNGEFPAAPPESCGCPPFCHALEICRVAGGPRLKTR